MRACNRWGDRSHGAHESSHHPEVGASLTAMERIGPAYARATTWSTWCCGVGAPPHRAILRPPTPCRPVRADPGRPPLPAGGLRRVGRRPVGPCRQPPPRLRSRTGDPGSALPDHHHRGPLLDMHRAHSPPARGDRIPPVVSRTSKKVVSLLRWTDLSGRYGPVRTPASFLPAPNLWERLSPHQARGIVVQPAAFFDTPLTRMLYRGAEMRGYFLAVWKSTRPISSAGRSGPWRWSITTRWTLRRMKPGKPSEDLR